MRGFIILGALSALSRGAELPVLATDTARTILYKYDAGQSDTTGTADIQMSSTDGSWSGLATGGETCASGTKQSPIDIVTSSVKEESTNPGEIMFIGHDVEMTGKLKNDGRQIYYVPTTNFPTLYGGALSSSKSYLFDHLEFKFGESSSDGSEHRIDGKKYPMEIQLVFWDHTTQTSASNAGGDTNADSVVVLSYFAEEDTTDNAALTNLMTEVKVALVPETGTGKTAESGDVKLTLKTLLGDIDTVDDYYYYTGSQTSTSCNENVKWIIATDMLKISTTQLANFRTLLDNGDSNANPHTIAPNFRVVTGDSIDVYHRSGETKKSETYGEAATILGSTLLGIGTFGTVLNLLQHDATAKALKSNPVLQLIEDFDKKFLNGEEEQQSNQQFQQQQFQQRY